VLFFPYKLDIPLYRLPVLTALVCVICVATFLSQVKSQGRAAQRVEAYCAQLGNPNLDAILANIDDDEVGSGCASIFAGLRRADDRDASVKRLAAEIHGLDFYRDKQQDLHYKEDLLRYAYANFETQVPIALTLKLAYEPDRYNPLTMLTSTFAHASWSHLLGNLLFFFIFASCVESALGALQFTLIFLVMAIASSLAYSYSSAGGEALPAIGLSGVAMGMMAMLTTMLPRARIWCFFWFLLFFRRFTLPVLLIAAWHIGWNLYDIGHHAAGDHVNYAAHLGGVGAGLILGLVYRFFASARLEELEIGAGA
jgi:membrane associated rhomboid family serine protease